MSAPGSTDDPLVVDLSEAADLDVALVGGKAASLARMLRARIPVPPGIVLTTRAYAEFVSAEGIVDRVALELARKPRDAYRWEELWDAAHRIQSWFLAAALPDELEKQVAETAARLSSGASLVVRSSSPHEDSAERSFAGIHESVVGVQPGPALGDAVRTVWASLFSDRALLYRDELGLDPRDSAMAVVVQPLARSERSGIAFTRDPSGGDHGVIEAVWGLGEGLVGDLVEPDRWTIARGTGHVLAHTAPSERTHAVLDEPDGPRLAELAPERRASPPLGGDDVSEVWSMAMRAVVLHGRPQDCEWTYDRDSLVLTQARPITTLPDDDRRGYLELRPSIERLEELRHVIEHERLPEMRRVARTLADVDLADLSDDDLHGQVKRVLQETARWRDVYEREFIPFAHGARLFGTVYVSLVRPEDPFEFILLLARTPDELEGHRELLSELGIEYPEETATADRSELERAFLARADAEGAYEYARQALELGRASWRLRDDDNLYLELIERERRRIDAEVTRRTSGDSPAAGLLEAGRTLRRAEEEGIDSNRPVAKGEGPVVRPRQIVGQPASPGVAEGPARIVAARDDLLELRPGEIVVADALEPDTAAYATSAAGIVERRGGMLVHGAIVAREHGLPAVTGIADATRIIRTGERVTVDGYLGLVVLDEV